MTNTHARTTLAACAAAVALAGYASPAQPQEPAKILVGVTGYGESRREFGETVTNAQGNLFVKWGPILLRWAPESSLMPSRKMVLPC